jgi:ferric-dicitrate binding protein FerR (iron transport regulator)
MSASEDRVRHLVLEQATDWYLINREPMSQEQRDRFLKWLKSSPANIKEYLAVHRTALDLASIKAEPGAIEALVTEAAPRATRPSR